MVFWVSSMFISKRSKAFFYILLSANGGDLDYVQIILMWQLLGCSEMLVFEVYPEKYGTKYSRMDEVKSVEDSLLKSFTWPIHEYIVSYIVRLKFLLKIVYISEFFFFSKDYNFTFS